jgi:hypothetical protein
LRAYFVRICFGNSGLQRVIATFVTMPIVNKHTVLLPQKCLRDASFAVPNNELIIPCAVYSNQWPSQDACCGGQTLGIANKLSMLALHAA